MSIQVSLLSRAFFLCFCWNLLLFLPPSFIRFFVVGVQAFSCFSYYVRVGKLDSLLHLQPIVNEAFEDLSVQLPTNVDSKMVGVSHTISIQWPIGEIINTSSWSHKGQNLKGTIWKNLPQRWLFLLTSDSFFFIYRNIG